LSLLKPAPAKDGVLQQAVGQRAAEICRSIKLANTLQMAHLRHECAPYGRIGWIHSL
jgi:hypothetical protein